MQILSVLRGKDVYVGAELYSNANWSIAAFVKRG